MTPSQPRPPVHARSAPLDDGFPSVRLGAAPDGGEVRSRPRWPITVVGPTGSGKTARFAVPTLVDWPGPAVVLGARTDLLDAAYDRRSRRGPVRVLDPEQALRCRYPAARLDLTSWLTTLTDALDVAVMLLSSGGAGGSREDGFWSDLAQLWTAPILFAGARAGLTFREIIDIVLEDRSVRAEVLVAETGDPVARRMLGSVLGLEERTRSGVLATVAQALRVFNRPGVPESVSCGTFRLDEALDDDGTVVLSLPGFRMDQVAPLFSAVLALIWARVQTRAGERTGAPVRPLLLLVDDAAHIPAVTGQLLEWATTARGLDVQLVTVWQDVGQLTARFGAQRSTLLNSAGSTLFLEPGWDPDTAEFLTRLVRATRSGGDGGGWVRPAGGSTLLVQDGRCRTVSLPGAP